MRKGSTIVRVVCVYAPLTLPRPVARIALLLAAALALALLVALDGPRVGAQGGCRTTEDLGALSSWQTLTRTALLNESSCKFEGVQYYDQYFFTMPGTGTVTVSVSAPDIRAQIVFNTESGELIAGNRIGYNISRTFPAGRYRILIVSTYQRDAGVYTVTIKTGEIDAPPPPPEPEQQELQPGAQQTQSAATAPGQIAVQVAPLPSGDQRGSYLVRFAFLTDAILRGASSRSAATEANQNLWPHPRAISESTLRQRAQTNNRRWMRSGPVTLSVPLSDGRSATLKGYVIARQVPRSGESVRIEFGFLPERALSSANGDVQIAARAALIPDLYVLLESKITQVVQRGSSRWFFSSSVNAPLDAAPPRQPITITPGAALSLQRGQTSAPTAIATVSAGAQWTATLSGLPLGLQYAPGPFPAGQGPITVFGTILPSAEARPYTVNVSVRDVNGQTQTARVTLTVTDPPEPKVLSITWRGYLSAQLEVGGNLSAVRPQIVAPSPPPSSARITYSSGTPSVCLVNTANGAIRALAAGSCQVTATASAPGYQSGTARATVTVTEPKVLRITWRGYLSAQVEVDGNLSAVPAQIVAPSPPPSAARITYRSGTPSVCAANPATGAINALSAGFCQVTATATAPGYQSGTADARVSVVPREKVTPTILWNGYGLSRATAGQGPLRPQNPLGLAGRQPVRLLYSYQAGPATVCYADSSTGVLTLVGAGQCSATVSSAETDRYNPARATVSLTITPAPRNRPPTANEAPPKTLYLGCGNRPPEPQSSIPLQPLFSDPDGDDLTYSVVQYDSSIVTASVDTFFVSLRILVADGVDEQTWTVVRFRATDPGGLYGDNLITVTIAPCPEPGHTVEGGDEGTDDGDDDDVGIVDSPYDRGPYPP